MAALVFWVCLYCCCVYINGTFAAPDIYIASENSETYALLTTRVPSTEPTNAHPPSESRRPLASFYYEEVMPYLPYNIHIDYIFCGVIAVLLCCLCCCCFAQICWYYKTKRLKKDVDEAQRKQELKIIRPVTPQASHNSMRSDASALKLFPLFTPLPQDREYEQNGASFMNANDMETQRIVYAAQV